MELEEEEPRRGGILLHISSLPGGGPIGDLGEGAERFLDWLAEAGCKLWQVLPLNPVGAGRSPYSSPSAFACESALLSLDLLAEDGLLERVAVPPGQDRVHWELVDAWKRPLLRRAADQLVAEAEAEILAWAAGHRWAWSWALYRSLIDDLGPWSSWPDAGLRAFEQAAVERERERRRPELMRELALQFLFERQWLRLRKLASARGIQLLGDMPIFVSAQSCDTWEHPELFLLDENGAPSLRAGVPPDYFAKDGQLWGNPLFDWPEHRKDGFAWWGRRLQRALDLNDRVRLDHFRGFVACWAIPAGARTARAGSWTPTPGRELFAALRKNVPGCQKQLPLIAEDLGSITSEVDALRDELQLPGMKVLQFAFGGGGGHPFLPHSFESPHCVVYTGTHDNNTARGWYEEDALPGERDGYRQYVGRDGSEPGWDLIRLAWASVARDALTPLQDVLKLPESARMNTPGVANGNWSWRARELPAWAAMRLREFGVCYGRC